MPITTEQADWETLGLAIRERRQSKALTLTQLAKTVGLSQPFLSQIETGSARPSLRSLQQIAEALDTTPQAFFGGPIGGGFTPSIGRSNEGQMVSVAGGDDNARCNLRIAGNAPFHLLEFDGLPTEFMEYFEHEGFEATYVIAGKIELDIAGEITVLSAGDVMSYPSHLPHRLRSIGRGRAHVLLVETKVTMVQDRGPDNHGSIAGIAAAKKAKPKPATPKSAMTSKTSKAAKTSTTSKAKPEADAKAKPEEAKPKSSKAPSSRVTAPPTTSRRKP